MACLWKKSDNSPILYWDDPILFVFQKGLKIEVSPQHWAKILNEPILKWFGKYEYNCTWLQLCMGFCVYW